MRNLLSLLLGLIALSANIPYIRDAWTGKTKPNLASWTTWLLINGIATLAAISEKAFQAATLTGANFIGLSIIILIALYKGTRKYSMFDIVCQVIALCGLILWRIFDQANIAIALALFADIFAVLPTFKHAYLHPEEETWPTFFIAGLAALGLALIASRYTFAALALPIDIFITNMITVSIVLQRRHSANIG